MGSNYIVVHTWPTVGTVGPRQRYNMDEDTEIIEVRTETEALNKVKELNHGT